MKWGHTGGQVVKYCYCTGQSCTAWVESACTGNTIRPNGCRLPYDQDNLKTFPSSEAFSEISFPLASLKNLAYVTGYLQICSHQQVTFHPHLLYACSFSPLFLPSSN